MEALKPKEFNNQYFDKLEPFCLRNITVFSHALFRSFVSEVKNVVSILDVPLRRSNELDNWLGRYSVAIPGALYMARLNVDFPSKYVYALTDKISKVGGWTLWNQAVSGFMGSLRSTFIAYKKYPLPSSPGFFGKPCAIIFENHKPGPGVVNLGVFTPPRMANFSFSENFGYEVDLTDFLKFFPLDASTLYSRLEKLTQTEKNILVYHASAPGISIPNRYYAVCRILLGDCIDDRECFDPYQIAYDIKKLERTEEIERKVLDRVKNTCNNYPDVVR